MDDPRMVYRANRHTNDKPSDLERYGEAYIVGLFGQYMFMMDPHVPGRINPNHNFGPIIEDAARIS